MKGKARWSKEYTLTKVSTFDTVSDSSSLARLKTSGDSTTTATRPKTLYLAQTIYYLRLILAQSGKTLKMLMEANGSSLSLWRMILRKRLNTRGFTW
jgi:hypothetical protein